MSFSPPKGVTFHTPKIALADLCKLLRQSVAFLQELQPSSSSLRLYHDWWQHDGLHFDRQALTFQELFAMVQTPRAIFEATPDDDEVFVGVAPEDGGWYLRFRAEWDADGRKLVGGFAVTVPAEKAPAFSTEVGATSPHRLVGEPAERYYERVIV